MQTKIRILLLSIACIAISSGELKAWWYNNNFAYSNAADSVAIKQVSGSFRLLEVPAFLVIGGLVISTHDAQFRGARNHYVPEFHEIYDNFTQYVPAAVMLGLKLSGVESQSSWGQMLVADAFSIVVMAGIVNTLKYTVSRERPDASSHNSFPSGHTATAFMTATMLHKEYGYKSPWYSIGAYTFATATGLTRVLNNRHWMGDVMVGAGVGIIATEIGYMLADLVFKNKTKPATHFYDKDRSFAEYYNPSFVGMYLGMNNYIGMHENAEGESFDIKHGNKVGIEGAYFFNKYIGIGGLMTVSTSELSHKGKDHWKPLNVMSAIGGAYGSIPLSTRFNIGGKVLAGVEQVEVSALSVRHAHGDTEADVTRFSLNTGLSASFLIHNYLGIKVFTDYKYLPHFILDNKAGHEITFGIGMNIML
jgi:membrane-associated phospholipid phosphatase